MIGLARSFTMKLLATSPVQLLQKLWKMHCAKHQNLTTLWMTMVLSSPVATSKRFSWITISSSIGFTPILLKRTGRWSVGGKHSKKAQLSSLPNPTSPGWLVSIKRSGTTSSLRNLQGSSWLQMGLGLPWSIGRINPILPLAMNITGRYIRLWLYSCPN